MFWKNVYQRVILLRKAFSLTNNRNDLPAEEVPQADRLFIWRDDDDAVDLGDQAFKHRLVLQMDQTK